MNIQHPLPLSTKITVLKPTCPCKGAKHELVQGTIGKIISNPSGYWYYLTDKGITVKGEWIQSIDS